MNDLLAVVTEMRESTDAVQWKLREWADRLEALAPAGLSAEEVAALEWVQKRRNVKYLRMSEWRYSAFILAATVRRLAASPAGDSPRGLYYELEGVITDVEKGRGFDAVCLATIKRVQAALASAPAGDAQGEDDADDPLNTAWAIREAFTEWADEYLTDGNGYASTSTYAACNAAFRAAWPNGNAAAEKAASAKVREVCPGYRTPTEILLAVHAQDAEEATQPPAAAGEAIAWIDADDLARLVAKEDGYYPRVGERSLTTEVPLYTQPQATGLSEDDLTELMHKVHDYNAICNAAAATEGPERVAAIKGAADAYETLRAELRLLASSPAGDGGIRAQLVELADKADEAGLEAQSVGSPIGEARSDGAKAAFLHVIKLIDTTPPAHSPVGDDGLDFEPDEQHTVSDMANVGYSLMQAIKTHRPEYCWNESPAEIVSDLMDELHEFATADWVPPTTQQTGAVAWMLRMADGSWKPSLLNWQSNPTNARPLIYGDTSPGARVDDACTWTQQEDGYDCYSTGCGHEFMVNDGPPEWPYCCYCAKPIKAVAWPENEDATNAR